MKDTLNIKWPWEMIWMENADEFIAQIKEALPPDHELQNHELFPGIKWERRSIFIVDDDTTGQCILMNLEQTKRWKTTRFKVPTMQVFKDNREIAEMIERDHLAERAKYDTKGT